MLTFSHFHYRPKRGIQQGRFAAKIAAYDAILCGQTKRVSKGVIDMCDTAFWRGMAAGMAAGAIIGMTVAEKRKAMKTCVGPHHAADGYRRGRRAERFNAPMK